MFVLEIFSNFGSEFILFQSILELSEWVVSNKHLINSGKKILIHDSPAEADKLGTRLYNKPFIWDSYVIWTNDKFFLFTAQEAPHALLEQYRISSIEGLK